MVQFYACRLPLHLPPNTDVIDFVALVAREWLGPALNQAGGLDSPRQPALRELPGGGLVRWEPFVDFRRALVDLTWRAPDPADAERVWVTSVTVTAEPERAHLSLKFATPGDEASGSAVMGVAPWTTLLPIVAARARVDGPSGLLALEPRRLEPAAVPDFVRYELFDPGRRYPILLVTPDGDGRYAAPLDQIGREFLSLAGVVALASPDATFALTDALGRRELSAWFGAMRIYRPGFDHRALAPRHPLILAHRAADPAERAEWAASLARDTVRAFVPDPDLGALRVARDAAAERNRQALLAELSAGLLPEHRRWRTLAVEYRQANEILREQLAELERRVRELEGDLERANLPPAETVEADDGPRSALEAVEAAAAMYDGAITFLPSAFTSAAASPYRRTAELARVLGVLADVSRRLRVGPLGRSLRDVFQAEGVDYRGGISKGSSRRVRDQFRFTQGNVVWVCEEHIALGGATYEPETCLRIYLKSETGLGLVIGHVGRHLDTMSTN